MAKGVNYTKHLDETLRRGVYETQIPNLSFLYRVSTTIDPNYVVGDRVCLPDGRVFRYCKASGTCTDETGAAFTQAEVQTYNTVVTTIPIGSTSVIVNGGTHDTLTADCLRGGYIIMYSSTGGPQFRGITGNTAALTAVDFTVYFDAETVSEVVAAAGVEVFYNPWNGVSTAINDVTCSFAGMPVAPAASGSYLWVQTWGPVWCPPTTASFADANDRGAYWRHSGAIEGEIANASKTASVNSTQYAGFLITKGFTAGPLLMLQVSP